jgi:hypothetical protein
MRRERGEPRPGFSPRDSVVVVLGLIVAVLGGRRIWHGLQARRSIALLGQDSPAIEEIERAARHGRAALEGLVKWLDANDRPELRLAAARGLARLWREDQLVGEEERAVVVRAYEVRWRSRRRYPRELSGPIPIEVEFGVPALVDEAAGGIPAAALEWSHAVVGSRRASLERPSDWEPGPRKLVFTIESRDFSGSGPQRMALAARVRTAPPLSSRWEHALPQVPWSVEFDPNLDPASIEGPDDEVEGDLMRRSIQWREGQDADPPGHYVPAGQTWALHDPPRLGVLPGRPRDLAHRLWLEIEGVPGRFAAGSLTALSDRAAGIPRGDDARIEEPSRTGFEWLNGLDLPADALGGPGQARIRIVLVPDRSLAWTNPDVRSLWPGTGATAWREVEVVRA